MSTAYDAALQVVALHWLTFEEDGRIVGCHCGFRADPDDCGYGDSVLKHIAYLAAKAALGKQEAS